MITFLISLVVLIVGFALYSKLIEKVFRVDDRQTPAVAHPDGVDYTPMKTWRLFLIQLLNIAGLGPIFGALAGACWGPRVYLWIVFGTILGGGVHDYLSGMLSERHDGASISEIVGKYLGKFMLQVMRVFSVILLILVGVNFSKNPAQLLAILTPESLDANFWLAVVLIYYFIATFLPIDKVIGKLYPIFGACLIIMAVGIAGVMLIDGNWWQMEAANTFESMADFYGDELSAENRNIGIMPLPKANEQKVQEGKESGVRQTIVDAQYSVAFIKSTIDENKIDLAKEFLRFVNTQESLVEYTTITNTPKALDYSLSETEMAQLSPYGRSTFTLLADSEIVYPYSKDPLYLNNVSFFRVLNMFNSYVGSTHYQWAAEAFRDYGITAEQYFTGMRSYYTEERWNQLT